MSFRCFKRGVTLVMRKQAKSHLGCLSFPHVFLQPGPLPHPSAGRTDVLKSSCKRIISPFHMLYEDPEA